MLSAFNCIILLQNLLQICRKTHKKCFRMQIVKLWLFWCTQYHGNTPWCATNEKYVGLCNTFWIFGNYVAFVRFVFLCFHCRVDCWVFHLIMGNFMQSSQGGCLMQGCLALHHEIKKWLIWGTCYCNLNSLHTSHSGSLSIRFPDHNYRQCAVIMLGSQ
jgi:hypothetical protein